MAEEFCGLCPFRIISTIRKSEAKNHLRNAEKELLLALRSVIDELIKETAEEKSELKKIEIQKE